MKLHRPGRRYMTEPQVCARYGVVPLTLRRWDQDPELGFPAPVFIRGRKYRDEEEILAWEARQAAKQEKGRRPGPKALTEGRAA